MWYYVSDAVDSGFFTFKNKRVIPGTNAIFSKLAFRFMRSFPCDDFSSLTNIKSEPFFKVH